MRKVTDLRIGEKAIIDSFADSKLSLRLLEMGCLPGTEIEMYIHAPLGDPVCVKVSDYSLMLRKSEAEKILIR